jgi:hypothetical protein
MAQALEVRRPAGRAFRRWFEAAVLAVLTGQTLAAPHHILLRGRAVVVKPAAGGPAQAVVVPASKEALELGKAIPGVLRLA